MVVGGILPRRLVELTIPGSCTVGESCVQINLPGGVGGGSGLFVHHGELIVWENFLFEVF